MQFRGFSGPHFFGSSRFLPSLSCVARLHKKDICLTTRLFKMDAEQNRFLTARLDFIFSDDSVVASTTHSVIFSFFQSLHGFKADPVSTRVKNFFLFST